MNLAVQRNSSSIQWLPLIRNSLIGGVIAAIASYLLFMFAYLPIIDRLDCDGSLGSALSCSLNLVLAYIIFYYLLAILLGLLLTRLTIHQRIVTHLVLSASITFALSFAVMVIFLAIAPTLSK